MKLAQKGLLFFIALRFTLSYGQTPDENKATSKYPKHSVLENASEEPDLMRPGSLGFLEPDSQKIPELVQEAAKSVYLIATPGGEMTTVKEVFGGRGIDESIAALEKAKPDEDTTQADLDLLIYQLKQCKKLKLGLNCKIFESVLMSSAYSIGDGTKIRTAFHAIKGIVDAAPTLAETDKIRLPVPVFVYSSEGKRLVAPTDEFVPVAEFARTNLINNHKDGAIILPNDDLVEIQLNRKIGEGLKVAEKPAKDGEATYQIGYPKKTDDRKQFGAKDSPGSSLRITVGKVLTVDEAWKKMGLDPFDLPPSLKDFYSKAILFSDADGAPGLSGGAVVNAKGELTGIYTAGNPQDGSASLKHISYSSNDFYKMATPTK